jgi:hypothetical protein
MNWERATLAVGATRSHINIVPRLSVAHANLRIRAHQWLVEVMEDIDKLVLQMINKINSGDCDGMEMTETTCEVWCRYRCPNHKLPFARQYVAQISAELSEFGELGSMEIAYFSDGVQTLTLKTRLGWSSIDDLMYTIVPSEPDAYWDETTDVCVCDSEESS